MDKDLSTFYAMISAWFAFIFGVEVGIGLGALAGAFLSVRFCKTKTTWAQMMHVVSSMILACIVVGGSSAIYPAWISLKLVAAIYGFIGLLMAEKFYTSLEKTDFAEKLGTLIDKVTEKWTR